MSAISAASSGRRRLFVTTALPYANGPFHIGHIMEYIQADIWVRFQRMQGHEVHFVCADDAHGAAIMLKADAEGITPQALVAKIAATRPKHLDGFHISFDHWHSTDSPENVELSQDIYRRLRDRVPSLVTTKPVEQFYDPVKAMFLPDRYIKGECPKCGAKDQYGDACEVLRRRQRADRPQESVLDALRRDARAQDVGALLLPALRPRVRRVPARSGRSSRGACSRKWRTRRWSGWATARRGRQGAGRLGHLARRAVLRHPDPGRARQVLLRLARRADRLSREPQGASARSAASTSRQFLQSPDVDQYHFIGKDIVYFHTLFWPAMLKFAGAPYKVPDNVFVHGFLTALRREDVEVARHRRQPATSTSTSASIPSGCATTSPRSSTRRSRTSTSTPTTSSRASTATSSASTSTSRAARRRSSRGTSTASCRCAPPTRHASNGSARRRSPGRRQTRSREAYEAREFGKVAARRRCASPTGSTSTSTGEAVGAREGPGAARRAAGRLHRCVERVSRADVFLAPVLPALADARRARCSASPRPLRWDDIEQRRRRRSVRTSTS